MTKPEAKKAAEAARKGKKIPDEFRLKTIEQQYIEVAGEDASQPAPVRDVLVWSARFFGEIGQSVELCVDDSNGQIVRVRKSR